MKYNCKQCEKNKTIGHNYCRDCGYHLTKGFVQHVRIPNAFSADEKYCGYCGGEKHKCAC